MNLPSLLARFATENPRLDSHRSVEEYRSTVRVFCRWWRTRGETAEPRIADLTDAAIAEWLRALDAAEYARPTINKHRRQLVALLGWAWAEHLLAAPPRVKKYTEPRRCRSAFTPREFQELLDAAGRRDGYVGGVPAGIFWQALLSTIATSGGRINAVMLSRRAEFDPQRRTLRLDCKVQKQQADQVFVLPPTTAAVLGRLIAMHEQERIFGCWPHDARRGWKTLTRHYRHILQAAGLPHRSRRDLFHKIRASVATWIAAELGEEEARKYLGHSNVRVTRSYLDLSQLPSIRDLSGVLPQFEVGDVRLVG